MKYLLKADRQTSKGTIVEINRAVRNEVLNDAASDR
jgi:hypothetical protein